MQRSTVLLLALLGSALAPAGAGAATLQTDQPCALSGGPVVVGGTGWTAGAAWSVTGGVQAQATVGADGTVTATATAPELGKDARAPKTFPLQAADGTQTAAAELLVVRPGAFWSDRGQPRKAVRWTFGGLLPDQPVYVHVRRGGKTLRTTRVGVAAAPCGTASKTLRRLPVKPSQVRNGTYRIYVDNRRRWSAGGVQYAYRYGVETKPRYR